MTDLRQRLHSTLDGQHTDLALLASQAQSQGSRLRRRRRLAAAGRSLAVLAFLAARVVTASGLLPGDPDEVTVLAGPASSTPAPERLTGLEALDAALDTVVPGTRTTDVTGMKESDDPQGDPYAEGALTFTTASGSAGSVIEVTYYPAHPRAEHPWGECDGSQPNCQVINLPDGSTLQTYDIPITRGGKVAGTNLGAARLVDGYIVSLWVQVPVAEKGGVFGTTTALTRAQLTDVLSQPEWGQLVPLG